MDKPPPTKATNSRYLIPNMIAVGFNFVDATKIADQVEQHMQDMVALMNKHREALPPSLLPQFVLCAASAMQALAKIEKDAVYEVAKERGIRITGNQGNKADG